MAKRKQWFGMRYSNLEPIYFDELGSQFETSGLVLKGKNGTMITLLLPNEHEIPFSLQTLKLTSDQWISTLKQLDNPEYYIDATKAIIGKNKRLVAMDIQWGVFRRDNYTCHFCGAKDKPFTIDHKVPVEAGGTDEIDNLLTACRPCNKNKGNLSYEEYVRSIR